MTDNEMKKFIYDACLKAAIALGDDIKKLSWFGRNWKRYD